MYSDDIAVGCEVNWPTRPWFNSPLGSVVVVVVVEPFGNADRVHPFVSLCDFDCHVPYTVSSDSERAAKCSFRLSF
jgi:hypothetical protein